MRSITTYSGSDCLAATAQVMRALDKLSREYELAGKYNAGKDVIELRRQLHLTWCENFQNKM